MFSRRRNLQPQVHPASAFSLRRFIDIAGLYGRKPDRFAAELPGRCPNMARIGIAGVLYRVLGSAPLNDRFRSERTRTRSNWTSKAVTQKGHLRSAL